jgi:SAM-dependent methyltransferase
MKEKDKEWINQRYSDRIKGENFSYEALRSGPWERREMRFQILTEIGIKPGDSVLDLGCGYGDLYDYFQRINCPVDYTGFDINPDFIEMAKSKYPGVNFQVIDVINQEYPHFDWVISTTCFNLKLKEQDNYEFVDELLSSVYTHAKKGVAIDFLTNYVDFETDHGFHYSPEKVFGLAKKYTKCVTLRHDYPIFEFCMYLFPDFTGWAK